MEIQKMLSYLEELDGKHIFLQPHLDDVPFSLNYFLDSEIMKNKEKKTITIFGKEYFNVRDYPHTAETEQILLKEESIWFKKAGIALERYELEEAGYRGIDEVRKLFRPRLANDFKIGKEVFDGKIYIQVLDVVKEILFEQPRCLWVPAAIGGHVDHLMLRRAVLDLCKEENNMEHVIFYEDYPYRIYSKSIAWDDVSIEGLMHIGEVSLEPEKTDCQRKYENLSAYYSQITDEQLKSLVLHGEFISVWKNRIT